MDSKCLSDQETRWFETDVQAMLEAPNVLHTVPESIDLLVLDGGEFSTFAEFECLRSRVTQWVVLDDTQTRKSSRIIDWVRSDANSEFSVVFEGNERNGVAVLVRNL